MSEVTNTVRRRVRGKSKVPALIHVNIRLSIEVLEFYKRYPSYTGKMREVLTEYKQQIESSDPQT